MSADTWALVDPHANVGSRRALLPEGALAHGSPVRPSNPEDHGIAGGRGPECAGRDASAKGEVVLAGPAARSAGTFPAPTERNMSRHHDVCRDESGPGRDEAPNERHRYAKRRVRHHAEGATRQTKVGGVGRDNSDVAPSEASPERRGSTGVELDGDNPGAATHEQPGEHAIAGTDVEHQLARGDRRVGDDAPRPSPIEPVPSPSPRDRGPAHGT